MMEELPPPIITLFPPLTMVGPIQVIILTPQWTRRMSSLPRGPLNWTTSRMRMGKDADSGDVTTMIYPKKLKPNSDVSPLPFLSTLKPDTNVMLNIG